VHPVGLLNLIYRLIRQYLSVSIYYKRHVMFCISFPADNRTSVYTPNVSALRRKLVEFSLLHIFLHRYILYE